MAADLANEKFWVNKYVYHDAEKSYYEGMAKDGVGMTNVSKASVIKSPLANEVAKAREIIKTSMQRVDGMALKGNEKSGSCGSVSVADFQRLSNAVATLETVFKRLEKQFAELEKKCAGLAVHATGPACGESAQQRITPSKSAKNDDDDDVDLFGSDSEEEDEEAKKIREQRLAEYAAKKSKKPALIAKSNIILDIKPWNDETDMKKLEEAVRKVEMDGLVWGASKLVPLVFGIYKLQISCVVEDDKVSVDQLTETLEEIEDYIQSVDIAAFNKV